MGLIASSWSTNVVVWVRSPSGQKPIPLHRQRDWAKAPDLALKRRPKGKLERRGREPRASGPPDHELPAPIESEAAVEQAVKPAPAPVPDGVKPTPPAVEFGL